VTKFDSATGKLKMLSSSTAIPRQGEYSITLTVTYGEASASCNTKVVLINPCEDSSTTFTLKNPPNASIL